ncbi:type II secretion system protein, partial [Anaerorhabdus sp.]
MKRESIQMKKNQNKKGFTLVELIVVIAILAVLGLLLVPQI